MLRPTAVHVEVICAYQILVLFDNGEKKRFDVVWPDGQDICPDELYDMGTLTYYRSVNKCIVS